MLSFVIIRFINTLHGNNKVTISCYSHTNHNYLIIIKDIFNYSTIHSSYLIIIPLLFYGCFLIDNSNFCFHIQSNQKLV